MAFARTTAVAGAGTLTCAGNTTVTIAGSSFAFGIGAAPSTSTVRVGSTITVGANTRTVISIQSSSSLTVDTAFPAFTSQAYTVSTGIIQTGTDTMNLSLGAATGIIITNRGDLFRTFDVQGLDLFIEGTLTVESRVAQLRNDGSCSNRFEVRGSASGGEVIFNGRKTTAANAPFPYAGFDWQGNNGNKITKLVSTNATYPAKFTVIDATVRFGADWLTTDSGNFSRITTQGDICWILCARGTGTGQARLRQDNTTAAIDFQATKTFVGVWLNFGVPQFSLKGYTPIDTDGPEINLASVPTASLITIDNYNTTHVLPSYYAGVQIVLLGSAWTRLKNNLLGTNIAWRSSSAVGGRQNVIEFSKQITSRIQDTAGNLLSDGYMYYQPIGSNVAGVRGKGMTTDITFDLSQKNIATVGGAATAEFPFAWGFTTATTNLSTYAYFCTGQTKGAETHSVGSSRYGYDKQYITVSLAGNNDVTPTYVHTSLPTSSKVIATAAAISGIAFNFTTKVMTITGNLTYQQIYDAYQYALNQTANLFQADNCLTTNSTSDYVDWTINVGNGVTLTTGSGNFTKLKANAITLTGTALINGIYQDSTGTSTTLQISGFDAGSSVYVEDNSTVQKYYSASATGTVTVYIPPTGTGSWYYAVEKYGNQRQSDFFTFSGGLKTIVVKALADVAITQATVGTVAAYTALNNPDKIYDYVAYLRLSVPHISYGQIVSKDGTALNLIDADLLVNQSFASVAEFDYDNKLLTIKSTSLETGVTFNLIKTAPPATITANTNEVISVNLEDANGDSSVTIQGGSGNFTLWKITNATPEDNYATGTNLGNVGNVIYRFLSNNTHKIVIRDNTTGFRQVVTMAKGNYIKGLFFGDQVQLAQSAEVTEINNKVDVVLVDLDAKLDVAISTRATAQQVWEYTTRTLTSAGASGATLAEIEASTILAKEATSQDIKTKVLTLPTLAEMEAETSNIAKDDRLIAVQTTMDQFAGEDFNAVTDSLEAISNAIDTKPSLADIENSTILAKETSVQDVKTKVDTLVNTDLTGIEADLTIINNGVKKASLLIPHTNSL
jgi:hypothetical protein